jgi:hypothetical protein
LKSTNPAVLENQMALQFATEDFVDQGTQELKATQGNT